jgi:hypothetical protein
VAAAAAQTSFTGSCVTNGAVYRAASNTELVSNTADYTNMPGVSVDFVQGGSSAGCVIVMFSAESFSPVGSAMIIRPRLDSPAATVPTEVQFAANDPDLYTSRAAIFIFRSVEPGPHRIRMQFRSPDAVRTEIGSYTLVVQHQR